MSRYPVVYMQQCDRVTRRMSSTPGHDMGGVYA